MADGKPTINYESYILPHELPAVRPREIRADPLQNDPDEQFFIRTHQAFEIWFAQILAEVEHARTLLSQPAPVYVREPDVPFIVKHVRRAAAIMELVRQHLPVLETLDTTSFYRFRKHLFGASGTQSYRFREVEWLAGLLDRDLAGYVRQRVTLDRKQSVGRARRTARSESEYDSLLAYQGQWATSGKAALRQFDAPAFEAMPAAREALRGRMADLQRNGSLRVHAMRWLARTAFPAPRAGQPDAAHGDLFTERFRAAYFAAHAEDLERMATLQDVGRAEISRMSRAAQQRLRFFFQAPPRRAIVFLLQFSRAPLLSWPAALVEALLELDQALANWRDRHIAMVSRVLGGGRVSTLGAAASGLPYLRDTRAKRIFPEIWDARSFLLSDDEAAGIYGERQLSSYGFVQEERRRRR